MNKKILGIIVIIVVLVGGAGIYLAKHTKKDTNNTPSNSGNTPSTGTLSSDSMTPSFTITATDDSADHEAISVKKGAKVNLTFKVSTSGVYHGGLQFKSTDPAIDSGPIAPGNSKTVTFTADKSFSFQPYWYASQVKKDYLITVTVQ